MTYSWMPEHRENAAFAQPVDTPHPALEPVSAWLFRQRSEFLSSGGLRSAETSLYSMAISDGGFDAQATDAFRARRVPGRGGAGHFFHTGVLEPLLSNITDTVTDPCVFVLPLPTEAVLPDAELRRRMQLGSAIMMPRPQVPAPSPRAIIGIVDHGINIFHQRFRSGLTGSRVAYAWVQGASRQGRLPFGMEWNRAMIEQAQAEAGTDEDALLRQLGADFSQPGFRPLAQQASHGTHVLDLAAGLDPDDPEGAAVPIIAVTLPPEVTRESTGSMLALPFALGLEYILDRARVLMADMDEPPPVYVNFSLGLSGGPRLGQHRLERTIHHLATRHVALTRSVQPPTVVVAAGNRNLARGHARSEQDAAKIDVTWHIQPADPTANFLELRVEAAPGSITSLDLSVTPAGHPEPITETLDLTQDGSGAETLLLSRSLSVIGRASMQTTSDEVTVLTLALAPSDPGPDGTTAPPAGDWQVRLSVNGTVPARIDATILRDDVPYGFRDNGRQSYLVDQAYIERDERGGRISEDPGTAGGGIRRAGTQNAIATGEHLRGSGDIRVVGGYVPFSDKSLGAADYSAAPMDDSAERVDVSAPSERSAILPGILAAGTRSGTRVRINGTSVAAPQLIRHLVFAKGSLQAPPPGELSPRLGSIILVPGDEDE